MYTADRLSPTQVALRLTAGLLLVGMGGAACSSSSPSSVSTTFAGIVTGDNAGQSGKLTVTASTATPAPPAYLVEQSSPGDVTATGTFQIQGGAAISLTGTYNTTTHALSITGSGYTFTGVFDGASRLEGTYTGPTVNGTFVLSKSTGGAAVAYCGTYTSTTPGQDNGVWNFVINGTVISGNAVSAVGGTLIALDGTLSGGTNITIVIPGTTNTLASGTLASNGSVSGTYDDGQGSTGTWIGALCQ